MKRVVVLCPGRASYAAAQLGSLAPLADDPVGAPLAAVLAEVDARREAAGDLTVRGMDAAEKFRSAFLQGHNAAPLIFAVTAYEMLRLDPKRVDVVAVGGNSMGWYSALWAAGALELPDAFDLVETMGGMTRDGVIGGQLLYPAVDDDWRHDAARSAAVERALDRAQAAGNQAGHSIRFGGLHVVWGDDDALDMVAADLPDIALGRQRYPLRLMGNSAFHSPLMADVAARGRTTLAALPLRAPSTPLIDGRGQQWRPLSTAPAELLDYTLGHQVTETFDFAATVRVALRDYAPDLIVALGPGESLGGAIAQVMIAEGWAGIRDREEFLARQREEPVVIALNRPEQAAQVVRTV